MLNPRDLLRRHSNLHEANHTRVVVSCDACRANKTKCSGGTQCSLCARRGITCTFRNGRQRSKIASTSDVSRALDVSVGDDDNVLGLLLPSTGLIPGSSLAKSALHHEGETLPSADFIQSLTIVPSKPGTMSELRLSSQGMEAIYDLLIAESSSLENAIPEADELHGQVANYLETFFECIHLRWPILNAPTFHMDVRTVPLNLAASVCVIGAWFRSSARQTDKFYALKVHEVLLRRLLHQVVCVQSRFLEIAR